MNEDSSARQPRWIGWTLCLVAVPVVYVLSVPPLDYAERGTDRFAPISDGLYAYEKPYRWVKRHTPLRKVLSWYEACWSTRIVVNQRGDVITGPW